MHIHILGICGTFMGSLALLAREAGYRVTGCDAGVYPPMSTQLEEQGIDLIEGFDVSQSELNPDLYVIGNAISRGNPLLEEILNKGWDYDSGPGFLGKVLLKDKWVLGVSGTHGKTTTTSMLAWILESAGMAPGFLIGGVPLNFGISARLGETDFFVIEADEYDTAFFDKRSKFLHYRPRTLIINNLEFDHADIFDDLAAIQRQFHHLIRTLPSQAQIISPKAEKAINETLEMGVWSECLEYADASQESAAQFEVLEEDGSHFKVMCGDDTAEVNWDLLGDHNVKNAVSAMLAARHVGVTLEQSGAALNQFRSVKRRMEQIGRFEIGAHKVFVYDDFAHHPTAISTTLTGLRKRAPDADIVAVIEPRSNTMKRGVHKLELLESICLADRVIWANLFGLDWLDEMVSGADVQNENQVGYEVTELIDMITSRFNKETHIVLMSNGGFAGLYDQLLSKLEGIETKD